ncbi:MAG: ribulose-phosphate 3-epimerase [Candidatus Paceibacterota bacterium]
MQIIPAINCSDFNCVKEKLEKVAEFSDWVQLDIADGKFTNYKTWSKTEELQELRSKNYELGKLNLEIHLMIEEPEKVVGDWVKAGVKRIIVHLEAIDSGFIIHDSRFKNIEIGLAINPDTPVEKLVPYLDGIKFVQILAVNPGLAGQKFQPNVLDKIKFLKENYPDVKIEVDGGINLETAKLCKDAGADIVVSASYIWNSDNPKEAFEKLKNL